MADLTLYRHDVDWRQQFKAVQAAIQAEDDAWARYRFQPLVMSYGESNRRLDEWMAAKRRLWDITGQEPALRGCTGVKRPLLYLDEE